jgi:hypothetical protein
MLIFKIIDKVTKKEIVHKVESFPCTIGRSVKSTIIIDDDSISALHAVIDNDSNGVFLKDEQSTNGIKVNDVVIDQYYIHENTKFLFGEIELELLFDEEILDKTRVIDIPEEFYERPNRNKKRNIVIALAIVTILVLFEKYITAPLRKEDIPDLLAELFGSYFLIGGLSLIASVVSKVHSKKYKIINFLEGFSILVSTIFAYQIISSYLYFYANSRAFTSVLHFLFFTVLLCGFTLTILTIFFRARHKKAIYIFTGSCYLGLILFAYVSKTFNEKDVRFKFTSSFEFSPLTYKKEDYPFKSIKSKIMDSFKELDKLRTKKNDEKAMELKEYRNANP